MKIWNATVKVLGIVDLDSTVEISVRQLRSLIRQAYEAGKLDAAPPPPPAAEMPDVFKTFFGKN